MEYVSKILILLLLSKISFSQNSEKQVQYLNRMYIEYNSLDSLKLMEKELAKFVMETNRFGTKYTGYFEINGISSNLKISQNTNTAFYIKVDNNFIDVSKTYLLLKLAAKKKVRHAVWAKAGLIKNSVDNSYGLPTLIEKISDSVFKIRSEKSLEKGEYAFIGYSFQGGDNYDAFTFTIQ